MLIFLGFIVYLSIPRENKLKITLVPQAYQVMNYPQAKGDLFIHLYMNKKNSFLSEKKEIENSSLHGDDNIIPLELVAIDYVRKTAIKDETYYEYAFHYHISFPQELYFPDAILSLKTKISDLNLQVGSFSYYHLPNVTGDYFNLLNMKGLYSEGTEKYLNGILLSLSPIDKPFKIVNLEVLDGGVNVNKAIILNQDDQTANIDTLLAQEYHRDDKYDDWDEVLVSNEILFISPLTYNNIYSPNVLTIRLTLIYNNEVIVTYFPSFCFFLENNKIVHLDKLIFYEYSLN